MAARAAGLLLCFAAAGVSCQASDSPRAVEVLLEPACPSTPPPLEAHGAVVALVGELLLKTAIGTAVDAAGAYLTSAASSKSVALKGSAPDRFYEMTPVGTLSLKRPQGCLVLIVRGAEPVRPWFERARERSPALRGHDRLPQFYFEAAFERPSDSAQALTIRPQFMHVGAFQESSGWSHRSSRKYSVAFTLRNREDGKPFGAVAFNFDDVEPGTWGETRTIQIKADGTKTEDQTIKPTLNPRAAEQRLDWLPISASLEAAAKAQALVAAPYLRAAKVANATPADPVLQVPEWAVRSGQSTGPLQNSFEARLKSFCDSLEKHRKGAGEQAKDARCPVDHLKAANDLEEARAALQAHMEKEWAAQFQTRNAASCKRDLRNQVVCLPPAPKPSQLGDYTWEATVVETREPTAFATALAAAFASNKEKIKADLEEDLLPSKREQARQAAESAQRDAMVQYRLAVLKVEEAQAKLAEAATQPRSAQLVLQADVLKAKITANAAARAAKQPEPFPD